MKIIVMHPFLATTVGRSCCMTLVCGIVFGIGLPERRLHAATPVYSQQKTFYVPFTVPYTSQLTEKTRIQLYVSGDSGLSWQLYQTRSPAEGRFSFRAGMDGEYLFAVNTLHDPDRDAGPDDHEPVLAVRVDTEGPYLDLQLTVSPQGKVQSQWQISDPCLDPASFQLSYRTQSEAAWIPLRVRYPEATESQTSVTGQLEWWPEKSGPMLFLQAVVKDLAGNETVVERQSEISATNSLATRPNPYRDTGSPDPSATPVPPPANVLRPAPASGDPFANYPDTGAAAPVPAASGDFAEARQEPQPPGPLPPEAWTAEPNSNGPAASSGWRPSSPESAESSVTDGGYRNASPPNLNGDPFSGRREDQPVPSQSPQPPSLGSSPRQDSPLDGLATGDDTRASNSRRFELEYDVQGSGSEGLERVELWWTHEGKNWEQYGLDSDKQSPFLVTVPEEGRYGFRLLVQGRRGIRLKPPVRGDDADVWILVDTEVPNCHITSAQYGRGAQTGQLQIYWDAADPHLAVTPVTLLYSERPTGPWLPIASRLANAGRYDWRVTADVPSEIYLRLEVRDLAGNVGVDALRDPISGTGLAPKALIRGIRPLAK